MSTHQQGGPDGPGPQDPSWPVGAEDLWDADELDELLAHPCRAGRLGQVLSAAAAATTQAERQPGEEEALRAFRAAATVSRPGRGARLPVARLSGKAAAVALAGGLVLSGGAAAAATGALPGAAQQTARSVLARIGVNVPGPDAHAGGHPGVRGTSTHSPSGPAGRNATAPQDKPSSSDGRSAARSTATPGAGKGAAVSGVASAGKSRAGQHGNATRPPSGKKSSTAGSSKRRAGTTQAPPTARTQRPTTLPLPVPIPSAPAGLRR